MISWIFYPWCVHWLPNNSLRKFKVFEVTNSPFRSKGELVTEFYKHQRINNGKRQVLKVRFFPSCWPSWRRLKYLCKFSVLKYYHHSITVTSQCSLWNVREWDFTGTMLKISHFVSSCWFFCKINYLYLNLRHSLFYGIGKEITTIRGKYWRPGFVLSSCWPSWRSLN